MSSIVLRFPDVKRGRRSVLQAGEIRADLPAAIGLIGINGSGKTSLFMHLAGALTRARLAPALVELNGTRPTLAYVPQSPALPPWPTARQAAELYGLDFAGLLIDMPALYLDELEGRRCGQLSLGQQQALTIAIALGRDAGLIMLDEPLSALDFRRRIGTIELLRERMSSGRHAILISSQSAADLAGLCTHYIVVREGRILFDGPLESLAPHGTGHVETRLLELLS